MNRNEIKCNRIARLIEEDYTLGVSLVNAINGYNGELEHLEYICMDEFNSFTEFMDHLEIARRIFYGKGFNPRDAFFRFDGYGNLESFSQWEVKAEILDSKEEIAETLLGLWGEKYFNIYEDSIIEMLEEN